MTKHSTWASLALVSFMLACSGSTSGGGGAGDSGVGGAGSGGSGAGGSGVGGSGGSGVGGSVGNVCNDVCSKIGSANCPNEDPVAKCVSDCQTDIPKYQAQCGAQLNGFATCVTTKATITCTSSGSSFKGCDAEVIAWAGCTACIQDSNDDACDVCAKSTCCGELQGLYNNPDFAKYYGCLNGCADATCQQNCVTQYPSIMQAGKALADCQSTKCASSC